MVYKSNKKGAVEMSLNLIIMLIIGMVVLGLVISFVNSLVNKGTESFDKQLGDNERLKLEKVKSSPENLAVEPDPSIEVKKGDSTNIFIKVRAYSSTPISCNPGSLDNTCELSYTIVDEAGQDATSKFILSGPGFKATDGTENSQMYTLKAYDASKGTPEVGIYYLTLGLYGTSTEPEETKTLTIEVE